MELKQKGVSEEVAKNSVEAFSQDEENIYNVAQKYLKLKERDLKRSLERDIKNFG